MISGQDVASDYTIEWRTVAPIEPDCICVIGDPQNGKSTFARALSSLTGMKKGGTSKILWRILCAFNPAMYSYDTGDWKKDAPAFIHGEVRGELVRLGNAIASQMTDFLPMVLYNDGCRVISGIRRRPELAAFRAHVEKLGETALVIWAEMPDSRDVADNTSVTRDDADVAVTMYDGAEGWRRAAAELVNLMRP